MGICVLLATITGILYNEYYRRPGIIEEVIHDIGGILGTDTLRGLQEEQQFLQFMQRVTANLATNQARREPQQAANEDEHVVEQAHVRHRH